MRHYHVAGSLGALFTQSQASVWVMLLAVFLLVIIGGVLVRRARNATGSQMTERADVHEDLDGQIRALLTQAGDALNQDQIRDSLDVPVSDVARALHSLKEAGEIVRNWDAPVYTYRVRLI